MEQLDSDRQQQSSISAIGASNSPDLVLKQASPFKIWLACLSTALHQENTIPDDFEILHSITASSSLIFELIKFCSKFYAYQLVIVTEFFVLFEYHGRARATQTKLKQRS